MNSDHASITTSLQSKRLPYDRFLTGALSSTVIQIALLAGVTLVAAALRFYKLGAWSFWGDEILSVAGVEDGFNFNIIRQSLALTLIELSVQRLGVSEWSARLVPALIGVVSVPVLYFPIRKMLGRAVGLLSVLLLALSPWHLYWSQNARFYTLLMLFYALALLLFYLGLEGDRPLYLLGSVLFLGLAARESLLALFLVPVLGGYLLLVAMLPVDKPPGFGRLRRLSLLLMPGLLVAGYFAWPYITHLPEWLRGFSRVNNPPIWLVAGVAYYVRLSTVCMAVGGAAFLLVRRNGDRRQRAGLLLSVSAFLPLLLLMVLSTFHYSANRYVFVTLPSWLMLAAVAGVELWRWARSYTGDGLEPRWLAAGALLFLLVDPLGEAVLYFQYQNGNRDDWRAAFAFIEANRAPDDRVVTPQRELAEYYLGERANHFAQIDLAQIEAGEQTVWFVENLNAADLYPDVYRWLQREAELRGVFDVSVQARTFTMRVYRYEPPGAAP
ncbi:MAG TPA: glycosyltransferase family 39 protein [Candidatus Sulfomarinibacteraceae bacterium]|nr:glycosyltransferase family 39 protein [Candidatus Sulfomarinibacteraceae bacterium]